MKLLLSRIRCWLRGHNDMKNLRLYYEPIFAMMPDGNYMGKWMGQCYDCGKLVPLEVKQV